MPNPGDEIYIEERLKSELDKARVEYEATSREFHSLIKDIHGEIPSSPDRELRIRQTREASRGALQKYSLALKRFSEYTVSGIVPKDLSPPD